MSHVHISNIIVCDSHCKKESSYINEATYSQHQLVANPGDPGQDGPSGKRLLPHWDSGDGINAQNAQVPKHPKALHQVGNHFTEVPHFTEDRWTHTNGWWSPSSSQCSLWSLLHRSFFAKGLHGGLAMSCFSKLLKRVLRPIGKFWC